jgi:membrane-bound serine protease (ClpP class)
MELLQDPNITYLLLAGGLVLAVLALAAPGTGFLEIGALFILAVAGWGVITYDLPINWWAVALLILGAVMFALAVFRHKPWPLLAAAILSIVLGSVYFFQGEEWYLPAINPLLGVVVSVFSAGFFWIAGRKAAEAALVRPTHDLEGLIGQIGKAATDVHEAGSVQVASELWSASSEKHVSNGQTIRVIGRQGFTLLVEAVEPEKPNE